MLLVAHQEGGFSLFHLFGVVSGTFRPLVASYGLFRDVPFFTSNDVTDCFDLQIYYESTGEGNRFWQRTWPLFGLFGLYSPNILPLGIPEKFKFCYNQKKE